MYSSNNTRTDKAAQIYSLSTQVKSTAQMQDRCHLTLIVWYGLCSLLNNLIVPHVYLHQYLFFLHTHILLFVFAVFSEQYLQLLSCLISVTRDIFLKEHLTSLTPLHFCFGVCQGSCCLRCVFLLLEISEMIALFHLAIVLSVVLFMALVSTNVFGVKVALIIRRYCVQTIVMIKL